jgi:hypothetical protein
MYTRPGLLFVTLFFLSAACMSEDRRLSALPEEKRKIFLQNFGNSTFEGDIQIELTESLRSCIHSRRGFILVEDRDAARYLLFGDVILYRREGHLFDNELNPTRYDLNLVVRLRMIERETGRVAASFEEEGRTQYSVKEGLIEDEVTARRRIHSALCRKIYSRIREQALAQ